uniref:Integrin, alpha M (complement component 3 receptor 3 subunit) n=1 Tax=Cyprinus carpio carpio TaxID=630221 RepID=A0A9J8C5Y9_CYPCA
MQSLVTNSVLFLNTLVSQSVLAFNIDPSSWKTFTEPQNVSFGYKVIQKDASSLIVSDPLIQISNGQRGQIYNCLVTEGSCSSLNINGIWGFYSFKFMFQFHLTQICGPTIPKKCVAATNYRGMCFISTNDVFKPPVPSPKYRDCLGQIDIAFLLDGSGSVGKYNFGIMKTFVTNVIKRFAERDAQFAIAQYSYGCDIHYNFNQLKIEDSAWETKVASIPYFTGATYTANAIQKLVNELFIPAGGARPSAKKILLVITDGESHDRNSLSYVASQAEAKNIVRFAIGVGNAFDNVYAKEELNTIASDPDNDHVFKVTDFNALNNILQKLEENIIAIEGYSMAVATVSRISYAILGAPRYKHQGQVIVSQIRANFNKLLDSPKPQIGSYFGAEVCVVDLNSDSNTDLLLISAPTYMEPDREGRVFVYTFTSQFIFSGVVLVGMAGQMGQFGSSLASPADLNGDGFRDVLIGAPLEENGQGSIYIFNGGVDQINPTYSQRVAGSSVRPGLRFFGISLSQSSLDQSSDSLPDIAVGSMGVVLLLRSRPIMLLNTKVTYNPSKIPTNVTDCTMPLQNILTVCFTMSGFKHSLTGLAANMNYTIMLDAKRQKYRAYFAAKKRIHSDVMNITLHEACKSHNFLIEVSIKFVILLFILALVSLHMYFVLQLDFEMNCGTDNLCVDDLRMDFNFSGATNIEVGIMQEIYVTVFVENRGENSYNTLYILNYPFGLSYRRITSKQGRVECVSLDGVQGVKLGETTCYISKPILKDNSQVVFEITYSINKESTLGQNVTFKAEVTSGNDKHMNSSEFFKEKTIGVKYAIYVALIRHENSTIHINFTSGKKDLMKPVQHIIKIENDLRELTFKVFIKVPVKVGDADIWNNSSLQISGCKMENIQKPVITNFTDIIKSQRMVDCSVAVCAEFSCDVTLIKNERILYIITANVSSGWIEQTGLRAAVFQLVSSAYLDYDKSKYVFFSSDSQQTAASVQLRPQVFYRTEVWRLASFLELLLCCLVVCFWSLSCWRTHP